MRRVSATPIATRGIALLKTGKPDHAIADFDIAIKRNESDATVYSNRGAAYMSKKMFLLAVQI